jgi:hypothetical protein
VAVTATTSVTPSHVNVIDVEPAPT